MVIVLQILVDFSKKSSYKDVSFKPVTSPDTSLLEIVEEVGVQIGFLNDTLMSFKIK